MILSSSDGQYRGPMPRICPLNSGDWSMFRANEIVNALGRVKQVTRDLRPIDRVGQERERHRRIDRRAASREHARSRCCLRWSLGGVPVFRRPHSKPNDFERFREFARRRFPRPSGRALLAPDMDQAIQKCAGRDDKRAAGEALDRPPSQAGDAEPSDRILPARPKIQWRRGSRLERRLDPRRV